MGSGPAAARVTVFYGLPVRLLSLFLASIAYSQVNGALSFLRAMRGVFPRVNAGKAIFRLPPEVWDGVRDFLSSEAYEEAPQVRLFPFTCDKCVQERGKGDWQNVGFSKWIVPAAEDEDGGPEETEEDLAGFDYDGRCAGCGTDDWILGTSWWNLVREDYYRGGRQLSKLLDTFLSAYGLALASKDRHTSSHTQSAGRRTVAFVALPAHIATTHPSYEYLSTTEGQARYGTRIECQFDARDDRVPTRDQFLLGALTPLPSSADEPFRRLLADWPQLDVLQSGNGAVEFAGGVQAEVQEKEKRDTTARPGWRVSVEAIMYD
ncbi:hypothetical protein JCM8097_006243 [Rhodosporidiobolus ruineniae]